jgi:hypothetical protein
MELYDNGGAASLRSTATTKTGEWVWLQLTSVTIGTTSTDLRFSHSVNSATFYVAMPMINMGASVRPWKQRDLRYRYGTTFVVNNVDPGGAGITPVDITANTSPTTVMIEAICLYRNTTAVPRRIYITPGFDLASNSWDAIVRNVNTSEYIMGSRVILLDDGQVFNYESDAPAGDVESVYIILSGSWEWE